MTPDTKRLWAPWRSAYLSRASRASRACIFCQAKRSRDDRKVHVICRGRRFFVILNRYPYNPGHLMIAPYGHGGQLAQWTAQEAAEFCDVLRRMITVLTKTLRPQGFNVGLNVGRAAGAGVLGHLHWHVVPRWIGDTNVVPVTGGPRVMSASLDALYQRLKRLQRGGTR